MKFLIIIAACFASINGQCGRPQITQSRIVGGKTANAHSWPWQIGLHQNGGFVCGGSIVNAKWVITAAHCVVGRSIDEFTVKLGDHNRNKDEGEQIIQVHRAIIHSGFGFHRNNDLALLELAKPVMFGKHVQPICLAKQGDKPAVGSKCYITGWGKVQNPGSFHYILQQLGMKVQSKEQCTNMNDKYAKITDQMMCAGNPDASANQSGCFGDSGGPFVCQNGDSSWTLQGVISWGTPNCNAKDGFTVLMRVGEYRDWIEQQIN